jgi:hypothetical protein
MVWSETAVPFELTTAYTVPFRGGTVAFPFTIGAKTGSKPVRKARKVGADEDPVELKETDTEDPGFMLGPVIDSGGKALTGSGGFEDGQDTMNEEARVNTSFMLNATYNPKISDEFSER